MRAVYVTKQLRSNLGIFLPTWEKYYKKTLYRVKMYKNISGVKERVKVKFDKKCKTQSIIPGSRLDARQNRDRLWPWSLPSQGERRLLIHHRHHGPKEPRLRRPDHGSPRRHSPLRSHSPQVLPAERRKTPGRVQTGHHRGAQDRGSGEGENDQGVTI